jgi:hypothetical protein
MKNIGKIWSSVENESQMANFEPMVGSENRICKEYIGRQSLYLTHREKKD